MRTQDVAERLDDVLDTAGTFARLQQFGGRAWFKPWADVEATAAQLRFWEPMVINGLLQTPEYARALLSMRPNTPADEVDELVAARMGRQVVLDRPNPPMVWVDMDETALQREIGGASVMREQLRHLAEMSLKATGVPASRWLATSLHHCGARQQEP